MKKVIFWMVVSCFLTTNYFVFGQKQSPAMDWDELEVINETDRFLKELHRKIEKGVWEIDPDAIVVVGKDGRVTISNIKYLYDDFPKQTIDTKSLTTHYQRLIRLYEKGLSVRLAQNVARMTIYGEDGKIIFEQRVPTQAMGNPFRYLPERHGDSYNIENDAPLKIEVAMPNGLVSVTEGFFGWEDERNKKTTLYEIKRPLPPELGEIPVVKKEIERLKEEGRLAEERALEIERRRGTADETAERRQELLKEIEGRIKTQKEAIAKNPNAPTKSFVQYLGDAAKKMAELSEEFRSRSKGMPRK